MEGKQRERAVAMAGDNGGNEAEKSGSRQLKDRDVTEGEGGGEGWHAEPERQGRWSERH